MSYPEKCILRKQELDAFIAQAFSPELMNSQYLQELTVSIKSTISKKSRIDNKFLYYTNHRELRYPVLNFS